MTYFEKNEQKHFFPMFSILNAIGGIGNVADFTTPCVNITNCIYPAVGCAITITMILEELI